MNAPFNTIFSPYITSLKYKLISEILYSSRKFSLYSFLRCGFLFADSYCINWKSDNIFYWLKYGEWSRALDQCEAPKQLKHAILKFKCVTHSSHWSVQIHGHVTSLVCFSRKLWKLLPCFTRYFPKCTILHFPNLFPIVINFLVIISFDIFLMIITVIVF